MVTTTAPSGGHADGRTSTPARVDVVFYSRARACWGAEQSMMTLADELTRAGRRCTLVCFSPAFAAVWRERGLGEARVVPAAEDASRLDDLRALARARRSLPPGDVTVLFSYDLFVAAPLLRRVPGGRGTVVSADMHDVLGGGRGRAIQQAAVLLADNIVAVSRFTLRQVRHPRSAALYRPVHAPGEVSRPAAQDGELVVGIVGRLDTWKNHGLAIRALPRTKHDVRLVIRGDAAHGPDVVTGLKALVDELRVPVTFEAAVPQGSALEGLDALLVCNGSEPMGRTVAEAQLARVPVVVPSSGGSAELVEDGRTGLVFRSDDDADLARVLDLLADSVLLRSELAEQAQAVARERHDPARYAANYLAAAARRGWWRRARA